MTDRKMKLERERSRTCFDKMRMKMLEARRRRQGNPAASVAAQLLTLFTFILGRMPLSMPAAPFHYVPPPMSPGYARRKEVGQRLGVPARYVDLALREGTVRYALLFEHVRRGGRSREDAIAVLAKKAPELCQEWLDHVERWELWSDLLRCYARDEEETEVKLLKATLAWLGAANRDDDEVELVEVGNTLTPGGDGDPKNPDGDPNTPKL